jgi:hypothetical protein
LEKVFRVEEKRTVSNDWVGRYDSRLLQLARQIGRPPRGTVLVYEAPDGQIETRYRDRVLRWTDVAAPSRPDPVKAPAAEVGSGPARAVRTKPRRVCDNHPWRRTVDEYYWDRQLAKDRRAWAAVNPQSACASCPSRGRERHAPTARLKTTDQFFTATTGSITKGHFYRVKNVGHF